METIPAQERLQTSVYRNTLYGSIVYLKVGEKFLVYRRRKSSH